MSNPLDLDARQTLRRIEQKVNRIAIVAEFAAGYAADLAAMKEWAISAANGRLAGLVVWLVVVILIRYQFTNPHSI
jgi:hypothetical protein